MIKEYLQSLDGVSIYPIISLIIFVVFFAAIIIWLFKVDKNYIKKMENLPLERDEENNFNNTGDLHEKNI
jgi:hypothetical protein